MIARGGLTTLLLAGSLALTACGGGGDSGTAPTPTTPATPVAGQAHTVADKKVRQSSDFSRAFEKRVNRTCGRYLRRAARFTRGGITNVNELHATIVVIEGMAEDFETMKPPARNKRAWKRYTRLVRNTSDAMDRVEIEVADEDAAALRTADDRLRAIARRVDQASARNGFRTCAD
jgi:hypothetical protein